MKPPDVTAFFLRRTQTGTTKFEAKAFAKLETLGIRFEVVRLGGRGVWRVLRGLRGGAVVVLLYDLPSRWGPTVPVDVLGKSMAWVRGPYELAIRSEAIAVPFFCVHAIGEECHLKIGRVLDFGSHVHGAWGQATGVRPVAQMFADAANLAVRSYPDQWHHWNLIGEMTNRNEEDRGR